MQSSNDGRWFVFYTRPRFEKKIKRHLETQGIEHCLPTYFSIRKWKDRKKRVEMLYFPNYIFVKVVESKIWEILSVNGVANLVRHAGEPAVISEEDIEALFRLRVDAEPEIVSASEIDEGQDVIITNGPLKDMTGKVFKVKSKLKLGLKIEGINKSILIEISANDIQVLPVREMIDN